MIRPAKKKAVQVNTLFTKKIKKSAFLSDNMPNF